MPTMSFGAAMRASIRVGAFDPSGRGQERYRHADSEALAIAGLAPPGSRRRRRRRVIRGGAITRVASRVGVQLVSPLEIKAEPSSLP